MIEFEQHAQAIKKALDKAKTSHPNFCSQLTKHSHEFWEGAMIRIKARNDFEEENGIHTAENILLEEVDEAFESLTNVNRLSIDETYAEFYQICAVALRCIEYIEERA